jgi:hypothetical protein
MWNIIARWKMKRKGEILAVDDIEAELKRGSYKILGFLILCSRKSDPYDPKFVALTLSDWDFEGAFHKSTLPELIEAVSLCSRNLSVRYVVTFVSQYISANIIANQQEQLLKQSQTILISMGDVERKSRGRKNVLEEQLQSSRANNSEGVQQLVMSFKNLYSSNCTQVGT